MKKKVQWDRVTDRSTKCLIESCARNLKQVSTFSPGIFFQKYLKTYEVFKCQNWQWHTTTPHSYPRLKRQQPDDQRRLMTVHICSLRGATPAFCAAFS